MDLAAYFESVKGVGVLATSDSAGKVDLALYSKPHIVDESTLVFVMKQRFSHRNIKTNPHAAYMFLENRAGYNGIRIYLTMLHDEVNQSLVTELRAKQPEMFSRDDDSNKFVTVFHIDHIRPLVGDLEDEPAAESDAM